MNNFNQSFKPEKPSDKKPEKKKTENKAAKSEKINRIVYITAIALLLAVVVIAAVVSATNRAKKDPVETPSNTEQKTPENTDPKPDDKPNETPSDTPDDKPDDTPSETPSDKPSEDVSTKLPSFDLPVSGALSVKHDPDMQVFSPTMEDYRVHLGVDINTDVGAPVYAAADGKVEKVWEDVRMGWCVAVSHNGGAVSYYKNLDKTLASGIEAGASVRAGQLLGAIGDSAMIEVAQEPHLHFELTVNGLQVDPLKYFADEDLSSLKVDASVTE